VTSEGDEQKSQPAQEPERGPPTDARSGGGVPDFEENLDTSLQSRAEMERWLRLSTRGASRETEVTTTEMDIHAATTASGSLAAPREASSELSSPEPPSSETGVSTAETDAVAALARSPLAIGAAGVDALGVTREVFVPGVQRRDAQSPIGSADATRKMPALQVDAIAGQSAGGGAAALSTEAPSSAPRRRSSRPVKVPRPSAPPAEPPEVRGWRPSDPFESDEAIAPVVVPRPAPLPGAREAAGRPHPSARSVTASPSMAPPRDDGERVSLDMNIDVSGAVVAIVVVVGLVLFAAAVFLFSL
jgi:hypothetical protein